MLDICRSWLLGITGYGTVQWQDVYDNSVEVYMSYDIPLQQISYLYFMGRRQLLLLLSGPLDLPYSIEQWCIGTTDFDIHTH